MSDYDDLNKLVSKANKRYKRLGEKGWKTGAYKKATATGGKFSAKGTYRDKAREYKRVSNFLNSKTSTVRGSRKVVKNMLNRTGLSDMIEGKADTVITSVFKSDVDGSTQTINKFFDIASKVDEYLENNRGVNASSDEIWRSIHDTYLEGDVAPEFSDVDGDEIVSEIVRKLHKNYLDSHGSHSSNQTWSTI